MLKTPSVIHLVLLLAGTAFLVQCSETKLASVAVKEVTGPGQAPPPHGQYKIGDPYQVNGVWYYPAEDYNYDETGIASWYGPDFHGKFTANGEIFDQNDVSAAHRTLPMPSLVRVTNLENGRTLVVRVNDRGPYVNNRIIDLSRRAAQMLGFEGKGTAKVRVQIMADESRDLALAMKANQGTEVVQAAAVPRTAIQAEALPAPGSKEPPKPVAQPAPKPAPAPAPTPVVAALPDSHQLARQTVYLVPVKATQMYIQAGAFSQFDNANRLSAKLSPIGKAVVTQFNNKGTIFFRVRLGPLTTVDQADALLEKVIKSGYPQARIVVD